MNTKQVIDNYREIEDLLLKHLSEKVKPNNPHLYQYDFYGWNLRENYTVVSYRMLCGGHVEHLYIDLKYLLHTYGD